MESGTLPAKRPRVDIVPGGCMGQAPQLVVGTHKYEIDEVTALYFLKVLTGYLYNVAHRDKGPSFALKGDD